MAAERTRKLEAINKVAIETLSLGTHGRPGEGSAVLGTPTEVMQHIGELTILTEYETPKNIILAGGYSDDPTIRIFGRVEFGPEGGLPTRTVENVEIGEEGEIVNSQFLLPMSPFPFSGYSAVTLGPVGTDESKGLLVGGWNPLVENREDGYRNTFKFEHSTMEWDLDLPLTKHGRLNSSASVLPDGSPAICGGDTMPSMKSTEIRGEDGGWNLSKTAILHLGRQEHATTVVNGSMFALGGWTGNTQITDEVEIWDPRDPSGWNDSLIPPMLGYRCDHSVSSLDNSIFVFGGFAGYGSHGTLDSCLALDVRANKWNDISSMPSFRRGHSSIVIGDQIIIFAGVPFSTQIDSYDPATDTWTTLQHNLLQTRTSFKAFAL
jgi:N-acetylneuraminic acid mutarotase